MNKNYVCYHLHSDCSLLDSCTKYIDYINKAKELGQTAIAFTEHGNIYNWVEKKIQCDNAGIKYIHGVEVYMTQQLEPKVRDNYHTILLAKNEKGIFEINKLMEISSRNDHFYYKPRITFDEFLALDDNVIKISACLASPLNQIRDINIVDKLLQHYDYYEIQLHNYSEQIEYNKYLYEMAQKYHKELIVGTDTHSLNKYKAECRTILQKAKKIEFTNEDKFDLTYKSYDELIEMAKVQNALPLEVYLKAIDNTNVMAEQVETFEINHSVKYPILYGSAEQDTKVFKQLIISKLKEKIQKGIIKKNDKYISNIKEELEAFDKTNMNGFMLFMSELISWCKSHDIPIGFGRGSVCGSTIAYIIDITDVDPVQWDTVFSRFCNIDRAKGEVGDIDFDSPPTLRENIYKYIISRFDKDKTAYVLALGSVVDKGCIDEIGRALNIPLDEVANIKKEYANNPEETKKKYPNIFYYFDGMLNTYISQSIHPAGIIACPISLVSNYGTFWQDGKQILELDMESCHELNLAKYDVLGLKNVEIINDTCKLANIAYPLSYELPFDDKETWKDITISPVGIFQFESNFAYELLKQYKPQSVDDLTLLNAILRPSGASFRNDLIAGKINKNPSELIDKMLVKSHGYLVYQEQTIQFLQEICGLSGSEADNIRRAIGRKQIDRLNAALPKILNGYCNKSNQPHDIAEQEAKQFLQVIEDSASYQFGYNHATAYSMISFVCAYLRCHYSLEFVCAYLNNAGDMDDITKGMELAHDKGINIKDIQFGHSKAEYFIDKDSNTIYKGIGAIKYLNSQCADELYNLSKLKYYNSFPELYSDILSKTTTNSKQIEILVRLNYFKEFGEANKLLQYIKYYNEFNGRKNISKTKQYSLPLEFLAKYCDRHDIIYKKDGTISKNEDSYKSYINFNYQQMLNDLWSKIPNTSLNVKEIIQAQIDYTGSASYINHTVPDNIYIVIDLKFYSNKSKPYIKLYKVNDGTILQTRITDVNLYEQAPIRQYNVIKIFDTYEKPKSKMINGEWVKSETETDTVLSSYEVIA